MLPSPVQRSYSRRKATVLRSCWGSPRDQPLRRRCGSVGLRGHRPADAVAHAGSLKSIADRRGSAISVKAEGDCVAEIDSRRVERILRNLVVNAVEHGEGRPVEIAVAGNDSAVAVLVRDHYGVGLRPGEGSLVFNRFWRADPARARTTGGTGLGLAISLEDARLHDGWLQAWGEPGVGCFRLTLPRRAGVPIDDSPLPLPQSPHTAAEGAGDMMLGGGQQRRGVPL